VGYVDLRKRREERDTRNAAGLRHYAGSDPHILLAIGFVLGVLSSPVFYIGVNGPDPFSALLLLIAAVTLLFYLGWFLLRRNSESPTPKPGGEKQLLMAVLEAGGSITPVEAALETSLTVDEAEEILTRFADRGHLRVESRDGVLFYALPGRRLRRRQFTRTPLEHRC
jgi:prepilin signal peptidase PulO-like enzyme (type II secretory pathway)